MIEFKSVFDQAEKEWLIVATNGEKEVEAIRLYSDNALYIVGLEDMIDGNFIPLVCMETIAKSLLDLLNNLASARLLDDNHYRYAVLAYYDFIYKRVEFEVIKELKGETPDGDDSR